MTYPWLILKLYCMCCSAEYDVSGYLGQSKMLYSPEEVIAAGKGVCSGYASLCLKMCRSETSIPLCSPNPSSILLL